MGRSKKSLSTKKKKTLHCVSGFSVLQTLNQLKAHRPPQKGKVERPTSSGDPMNRLGIRWAETDQMVDINLLMKLMLEMCTGPTALVPSL